MCAGVKIIFPKMDFLHFQVETQGKSEFVKGLHVIISLTLVYEIT